MVKLSFLKNMFGGNSTQLSKHPLLGKLDFAINFQIDRLTVPHLAKSKMIRDFLKGYFCEFRTTIRAFVEQAEITGDCDPGTLIRALSQTLEKIDNEALARGIPEIFISKYNQLQRNHIESINASVTNVVLSGFYHSDCDKISAIFDVLISHFIFIILDSENTLAELNGKMEAALSGSIFDNE